MEPTCDWTLSKYKRSITPSILLQAFYELQPKYADYIEFYTNGAKTTSFGGYALFSKVFSSVQLITSSATIFTVELYRVLAATEYIIQR